MSVDADTIDLAVQYVMGELPAAEARRFEGRLAADAGLAAEVHRLRRTLGLLPFATAAEPPPALRGRILAAAEGEVRGRTARAPRRIVWSRFATAAAAAIALAVGVDSYRVHRELALQQQLAALLLEPNVVRSFDLAGAGGAYGRVALDLDAKRGAVVLGRLPEPPPGRIYRLWAQVGDKTVPCGDFQRRPDGSVVAPFTVPVESYTAPIAQLFVTVEPPTPAAAPTGPRVMQSV